jgi:hypothetical protein
MSIMRSYQLYTWQLVCFMQVMLEQPDCPRQRPHNLHETFQLPRVQLITPDDGHSRCLKHVEFRDKIKFWLLDASCWLFIRIFLHRCDSNGYSLDTTAVGIRQLVKDVTLHMEVSSLSLSKNIRLMMLRIVCTRQVFETWLYKKNPNSARCFSLTQTHTKSHLFLDLFQ